MVLKMLLINKESVCLFSKNFTSEISADPLLLGGFFSAVSTLAKDLHKDEIKAIIMGASKILFRILEEKNDLHMIIIADQSAEDEVLKEMIDNLGAAFINMFGLEQIIQHASQTDYFEPFENRVTSVIQRTTKITDDETIDESKVFPIVKKPELDIKNLSLPFLFKTLKKNLARVIYSIFVGIRIVITGEPAMVKMFIDSLDIFSPHRQVTKIYWTEDIEKTNANLVGVPPNIADLFIDSTIINLEDNSVKGIKSNKYFEEITKKIKKLKPDKLQTYITEKIDFLVEKTKDLLYLINSEDISKDELTKFAKNVNRDILEILEFHLKYNHPKSINRIKKTCENLRNVLFTFNIWGNI
ncbi:MAG: hypothetical protein ACFFCM_09850 [Promethearchaeota archaeon]